MFTLVPTVLAHGGLATTDMPLTACLSAAFFALLVWAEEPTWQHSLLLGVDTALAVISKFTALGYFPGGGRLRLHRVSGRGAPRSAAVVVAAKARALPGGIAVVAGASSSGPSTPSRSARWPRGT